MPTRRIPGYRKQKRAGKPALAFVEVNGARRYLGQFGTAESKQRYEAFVAEWKASGFTMPGAAADLRVCELVDRYWTHAQGYYRKADGTPSSEQYLVKRALSVLTELYSDLPVGHFTALKLKAVRRKMIERREGRDWCRNVVNHMMHRIRRAFRWGTHNELVPVIVYQGLLTVSALKKGRTEAEVEVRETSPVKPVPEHLINGVLPHLAPPVAAMAELQLLTAARPGELCIMRACDLDRSNPPVWVYRPQYHKNEHREHAREIYIGPKAQEIIEQFFKPDLSAYLFSPEDAMAWHRERRHNARKTPLSCGNRPGTHRKAKPKVKPGERYSVATYRRAIAHACRAAFPPPAHLARQDGETVRMWKQRLTPEQKSELKKWWRDHSWHPHRLRHNAATTIRAQYGLEMASVILGHKTINTTEIYAEKNLVQAREAIHKIG